MCFPWQQPSFGGEGDTCCCWWYQNGKWLSLRVKSWGHSHYVPNNPNPIQNSRYLVLLCTRHCSRRWGYSRWAEYMVDKVLNSATQSGRTRTRLQELQKSFSVSPKSNYDLEPWYLCPKQYGFEYPEDLSPLGSM